MALGVLVLALALVSATAAGGGPAGRAAADPGGDRRGPERLALSGYDPAYGARPLRRLVQRQVGDRLARELRSGGVSDGDTVGFDVATDPGRQP